ncbi:MAG TPA: TetR/AcrR family transcriptional regulator, partial [Vicinamibacteria bacterium]|nr:TetR/AcrR family transcriptional regulator [Vicinamibacteria bacterium]
DAWYGRMLARLIDHERFPALAEVSAAGVFGAGDGDGATDFDFGLSRILAGVDALLRGRPQ